jgi:hypothetical protein
LSRFLNKGITWAIFQSDGNTFSRKHLLNKLHNGVTKKNDRSTNELPYDATQKFNVLNKYFCSITKLNDDDAVLPDFHDRCENILSQVIVTEQEVIRRAVIFFSNM